MVTSTQWSYRRASLTAGVGLLLLAGLGGFALLLVIEGLVTEGSAARTAADIGASEGLFRLGIVALFAIVALDVVVAWAMYRVFQPVHAGLSGLAALLRLIYSGAFLVAIAQLVAVPRLLGTEGPGLPADDQQARALLQIGTFYDIWEVGLVLFGLHLVVIGGLLASRTGVLHRVLGSALVVTGGGYVFDRIAAVLTAGSAPEVTVFVGWGELLLAFWLLGQARRPTTPATAPGASPAVQFPRHTVSHTHPLSQDGATR